MKKLPIHIILISLFCFLSCTNENDKILSESEHSDMYESRFSNESRTADKAPEAEPAKAAETRKIIKEGSLRFETDDLSHSKTQISSEVYKLNGYIGSESLQHYANRTEQTMTIRVPVENFDPLLDKLSEMVERFENKDIHSSDVTTEFIDIEARLNTKKELEKRFKAILAETKNIEDIFKVEREIGRLRAEIESIEGRLRHLSDRISYSTLTISIYQKEAAIAPAGMAYGAKFLAALKNGWGNLMWFLIGLTNVWPFIVLILAFALLMHLRYSK